MTQTNSTQTGGILRFDHVAIAVPDMDPCVAWYQEMLGAEIIDRWAVDEVGMEWTHLSIAGSKVELVKMPDLVAREGRPTGFHHLAFRVEDVDAFSQSLAEKGVEIMMGPNDFERHQIRWCFVKDCLGNTIELISSTADK